MATESPLIHDGSQTTAAADLSTGLTGQGGTGQFLAVKITGSRQVNVCTTGDYIYGVLQNKPASGQAADVGILGVTKAMSGGTVTAGDYLSVDSSSRFVLASSTFARVAVAIEGAAAASTVFTIALIPGAVARNA